MLRTLAAQLDKRNWRSRITMAKTGPPSRSCSDLAFYEDDDCFIRYRKDGSGQTIVFLCDGPATLELYDDLIRTLSSRFTVVVFETPANGFSVPKPSFDFRFQESNDVIARFLKSVAGERAILAFSCGGSYAAIDIATRYRELVSRLVIIQAPSWTEEMAWKKRRDPKGILSAPFVGQLLFPRMMKPRAPAWYELSMADTPVVSKFCKCTAAAFDDGATFALPTLFQNYLTGSQAPFEVPDVPTLAIWGEQDQSHGLTDKGSSRFLAKSVQLVRLDHVGHFPELEDPEGFLTVLINSTLIDS